MGRFWAFFIDGLVQHCRWGEVFMTEIQDHYARNINIIKTSCPVISIASHRTHWPFGGKYIIHMGPPPFPIQTTVLLEQGVTKRCRLSWLTKLAPSYCIWAQIRGGPGCGVSANEHSCEHRALINFGDLNPYLTSSRWGRERGALPPPALVEPFVHNNLEINSDM
jgi:hypothetical protein